MRRASATAFGYVSKSMRAEIAPPWSYSRTVSTDTPPRSSTTRHGPGVNLGCIVRPLPHNGELPHRPRGRRTVEKRHEALQGRAGRVEEHLRREQVPRMQFLEPRFHLIAGSRSERGDHWILFVGHGADSSS